VVFVDVDMYLLHLILYEVPLCDFHHIDGDLLLVPWRSLLGGVSLLLGWMIVLAAWWSSHMCLPC
jgi:hypothetical protein